METDLPWLSLDPPALAGLTETLTGLVLAMARPFGIALILPVFTRAQLGGPLRAGFSLALGLPALPVIVAALAQDDDPPGGSVDSIRIALLAAKEVFAGLLLGLPFGIPVWIASAAGDMLDLQRNAGQNAVQEPGGEQVSTTAALLGVTAMALFVAAGGLALVFEALYASYRLWPATRFLPEFRPDAGWILLGMLDSVMRGALVLAAPVLLAMLVADVAGALLSRAVPRLDTYDLAATVKNLVFVLMLLLCFGFLLETMATLLVGLPAGERGPGLLLQR